MVLMAPMFAFLYGLMPLRLWITGQLSSYYDQADLTRVQLINLIGVLAFSYGCVKPGKPRTAPSVRSPSPQMLHTAVAGLGIVGFGAWTSGVLSVGGFQEAYGQAKGGGWSDYGYVRDAPLVLFAAALLLLVFEAGKFTSRSRLLLACVLVSPWAIQGILGARRGPTFMVFASITVAWYIGRRARPPLAVVAVAGAVVSLLIVFLVLNRGKIYPGTQEQFDLNVDTFGSEADQANEYVYGAAAILNSTQDGGFFWGKRLLAQVIVRPVPRQLWPDKYADFGVPELEFNAGTALESATDVRATKGSAPGIVADMWLEFHWLAWPALYICGVTYGRCWSNARAVGGAWAAQYATLAALSLYFVMQTMEAVIFRTLIISAPIWFLCRPNRANRPPRTA